MKLLKTMRASTLATIALGSCLVFTGCNSDNPPSTEHTSSQEAPVDEPMIQSIEYDFAGFTLAIPEYWNADAVASETNSRIIFHHSEDQRCTLLITRETIPQFMTIKAQGNDFVEASDEEIAESYIGISVMDDEQEQTISDIETINVGDSSYMRKTFHGTANLANSGATKVAQRNALILLGDKSEYLQATVFCPEENEGYLSDADELMAAITEQI